MDKIENGVYRFYNTKTGTHFYTAFFEEAQNVEANLKEYQYEGVAFTSSGDEPFYRFFKKTGTHFYTATTSERDNVKEKLADLYNYEGESFNIKNDDHSGGTALYRFFNTKTGAHFYTTSVTERDNTINTNPFYRFEGVSAYVNNKKDYVVPSIPETSTSGKTSDGYNGVLPSSPLPDSVISSNNITITIPRDHPYLVPETYDNGITVSKSVYFGHSGHLEFDSSASTGSAQLSVVLVEEKASATSTVTFGGGKRMAVRLGPGTDTIHFGGAEDQTVFIQVGGGNVPSGLGGNDRVTGMAINDLVYGLNHDQGKISHDNSGNLVINILEKSSVTLIGVSSVSYGENSDGGYFTVTGLL